MGMKVSEEILNSPPEFPHAIGHIWLWFKQVIRGIQGNGFSYPNIPWTELDAWARRTRTEVSPREAQAIIDLGVMYSNIMSEKLKTDGGKG